MHISPSKHSLKIAKNRYNFAGDLFVITVAMPSPCDAERKGEEGVTEREAMV